MKYNKIGEVCTSVKRSIQPQKDAIYTLFSLPAFDANKTPEITAGANIKSNKFSIEGNLILFNKLNVHYRRVWNIKHLRGLNNVCSTEFIPLRVNECIDQDFLYYCLISDDVTNAMYASRKGTSNSQQRIDEAILFAHEIPVPEMEVQKRIASILRNLDDKITLNTKINENLAA